MRDFEDVDLFDRCGFFFFQAEDGIRDTSVTGVQTCALPISLCCSPPHSALSPRFLKTESQKRSPDFRVSSHFTPRTWTPAPRSGSANRNPCEIGRASCRERV